MNGINQRRCRGDDRLVNRNKFTSDDNNNQEGQLQYQQDVDLFSFHVNLIEHFIQQEQPYCNKKQGTQRYLASNNLKFWMYY